MTNSNPDRPIVRRAVVALDSARRRQVLEVLSYIEDRLHWIDPDMYRIERHQLETLQRLFGNGNEDEDPPAQLSVTYDEVFSLETCVMAADTYAHRRGERQHCTLTDQEFTDVDAWVATIRRLFITPLS